MKSIRHRGSALADYFAPPKAWLDEQQSEALRRRLVEIEESASGPKGGPELQVSSQNDGDRVR
jgi:hypothetical protein